MKLINFKISSDNIGLETKDERYFDLHNNFELKDFNYQFSKRYFEINFEKSKGDWVNENDPKGLKLRFINVQILILKELDQENENLNQFPEDDITLSMIGHIDKEDRDFLGVSVNQESIEDMAITIQTENGQGLIIYCESVELEKTDE